MREVKVGQKYRRAGDWQVAEPGSIVEVASVEATEWGVGVAILGGPSCEAGSYFFPTEHDFHKSNRYVGYVLVEDVEEPVEEVRSVSSTGAEKGVKLAQFSLLPMEALTEVAKHYGRGAEKYEKHNMRRGYEWSKSYDALMRHATQFWAGEDIDEETGSHHLTAVVFHALTLLEFKESHPEFDDRYIVKKQ